jgi:beta-lactam-binding protein with PASTA domain
MKAAKKKLFKKFIIGLALFLLLFVVCNDFLLPWYVEHGSTIEVPDLVGRTLEEASSALDSVGLEARKGDVRPDKEHPAGIVIVQNPTAGHAVKKGRRVYLTLSGGEELVVIPSVRGRTLRDATFLLERTGLRIGEITHETSDDYPLNTIVSQGRDPGTEARKGGRIDVTVSLGPQALSVLVPQLIGRPLSEARRALDSAGIPLGNITTIPSSDLLPNTVIEQYPHSGELVGRDQAVDLVVVQGADKDHNPSEY